RASPPLDGNDITFNFPAGDGTNGTWSTAKATSLNNLANRLKAELILTIGKPLWSGTVTVLNSDPRLGKGDEVIGALLVINGTSVEIDFPTFGDPQTEFLAMAQVMAQAFHGPLRIGYDAWEQGFARAAAVIAAKDLVVAPQDNVTPLDPTNGFYYTPYYDLLNQPALGNNTFTPPTQANGAFDAGTLSGMLIPRLQMSSTAWLKCYIEFPSFFKNFNAAYYDAFNTNGNTRNDITALRNLAKGIVPNVEAQAFDLWYEQQFVLDTSVTPGPKIYAFAGPTFPSEAGASNPIGGGAAVFLVYYNTTLTAGGLGDETPLNANINPIYWDYTFGNTLFLGDASNAIPVVNGFGTVAPIFENIGGTPADQMRVAMDFPANREYVRVYFPTGQTGTQAAPTDFSGVVVGANSGSLSVQFDNAATKTVSVVQGEFGATGIAPTNNFSRDVFTFTQSGVSPTTFKRNVLHKTGTASPIFKFVAPAPTITLTSPVIQTGAQMISLPIKPLTPDLAKALGVDPTKLLLAQYRQDLTGTDKYQRYPSLPNYQPGYGLWSNFNGNIQPSITGQRTDVEQDISVPLLFGWNQIGTPYVTNLNVTSADISISYLGNPAVSLAEAIDSKLVAAGIIGFNSNSGYVDILTSMDPNVTQNVMEAWKGYWIRVRVTEGVTIIYSNPSSRSARAMKLSRAARTPMPLSSGWNVPLAVSDYNGHVSAAVFGQSPLGAETFISKLDVASPPPFTRAATLAVRFPHPDWDTGFGIGGDFISDIRHSDVRAQWNVNVSVPKAQETYTLSWNGAARVPKGTRLTLVDPTNGSRIVMNTSASYTFTTAQNEVTRQFQIVAEPRTAGHLFIRNIAVDRPLVGPGRAASTAVIHYELSADAQTSVNISVNGRVIRHLNATGRAASSGV
ncbi:MAG: FlgD Ig-like domain, partial [Chthonomonadales bacterium]|nr:FlgD Ig-like domain [Chthonomonadales bacterium]